MGDMPFNLLRHPTHFTAIIAVWGLGHALLTDRAAQAGLPALTFWVSMLEIGTACLEESADDAYNDGAYGAGGGGGGGGGGGAEFVDVPGAAAAAATQPVRAAAPARAAASAASARESDISRDSADAGMMAAEYGFDGKRE